jgi:hypothetical protein
VARTTTQISWLLPYPVISLIPLSKLFNYLLPFLYSNFTFSGGFANPNEYVAGSLRCYMILTWADLTQRADLRENGNGTQ